MVDSIARAEHNLFNRTIVRQHSDDHIDISGGCGWCFRNACAE